MSLDSPHKYDLSRHLLGQALHLTQDFYSNTDWVEVMKKKGSDFYLDLGTQFNSANDRLKMTIIYTVSLT